METIQCSKCGAIFEKTGVKDKLRRFKDKRFMTTFHCPNCDARVILKNGEEPDTLYLKRLERLKEQARRLGDNQEVNELQDEIDQINREIKMNAGKTKDKKFSMKGNDAYDPTKPKNIAAAKTLAKAQGAAASDKDVYDPLDPENIAEEKELAKARGAAAADVKDSLFKGQKVTAIKSEQGLREGETYTVLGEEAIIKQVVGEGNTIVYKLQDSSGNVIVIENPEGLFYEVKDSLVPVRQNMSSKEVEYKVGGQWKPIEGKVKTAYENEQIKYDRADGGYYYYTCEVKDSKTKDTQRELLAKLAEKAGDKEYADDVRSGKVPSSMIAERINYYQTKVGDSEESESLKVKIGDIKKNMDAARKMGYDTEPYQKEIDKLETKDEWTEEEIKKRMKRISEEIDKIVLSGGVVGLGDPLSIEYGRLKSKLKNKTKDDNSKNGYYAGMTGKARMDNPFTKGTPEYTKWDSDWKIGNEDFKYESNKELFKPKDSDDKELKEMLVNDAPDYYGAIVATARRGNNPQMGSKEVRKNLEPFMTAHGVQFNEEEFNKAYKEFSHAGVSKAAFMKGTDAKDEGIYKVVTVSGKVVAENLNQAEAMRKLREYEKENDELCHIEKQDSNDSSDIYTKDPLTKKDEKILAAMKKIYGEEKGEQVFYASKSKGTISGVDSKTKDGNLDETIRKMAREKADVPYNDDGTIRTPQQAQLAYEQWYKIIKSRYKNDSRYITEYGDSKTKDDIVWEKPKDQLKKELEEAKKNKDYVKADEIEHRLNSFVSDPKYKDSKTKDGEKAKILKEIKSLKSKIEKLESIERPRDIRKNFKEVDELKEELAAQKRLLRFAIDSKTKDADPQLAEKIKVAREKLFEASKAENKRKPGGEEARIKADKELSILLDQVKDSSDFYTKDPLTKKGEKILAAMKKIYGEEKGEQIFYAAKNKGKISGVDEKTKDTSPNAKDGNLDETIRKMAREKADVPYNDDGTIRTPQQAQLAYEQWYKIIKSRYKNDSRYITEYGDSKTKDQEFSISELKNKALTKILRDFYEGVKEVTFPRAVSGAQQLTQMVQAEMDINKLKKWAGLDSKTKDDYKRMSLAELRRKAKEGYFEMQSDPKPHNHVEIKYPDGKKEWVFVEDQEIKIIIGDDPVNPNPAEQKVEGNDVIYKEYTLKQLPETGEFEIYAPDGSIVGHAKALELAKLFVDRIVASRVGDEWSEEARKKL